MASKNKLRQYSFRQNQIITLIATGHSTKEMALHLGLSVRTIEWHLAPIRRDIGCGQNDFELALWAYLVMDKKLLRGHPYPDTERVRETIYPDALPNTSWCSQCKGYLDRSLFYPNRGNPNKLDRICKMHRAIAKRQWLERLKRDPIRWAHLQKQQHMFYMTRKHLEGSKKYEQVSISPDSTGPHIQRRKSIREGRAEA